MPVDKLSQSQLDAPAAKGLVGKLQEVLTGLNFNGRNLTREERGKYGSINERNKLLVGKANDYHLEQPGLQSPDVDWELFDANWLSRNGLAAIESLCASIIEVASDTRILHDFDLYQMTLTDYDYTKYKAESTNASGGFTTKHEEMKQFFGNPTGNKPADPAPDA